MLNPIWLALLAASLAPEAPGLEVEGLRHSADLQQIPEVTKDNSGYWFMHIPKTAGSSFRCDAMHLMKLRIEAFGEHGEYAGQRDFCTVSHGSARQVLTMVRDPRTHVYSQYTHCLTAPGNKPFGQESMPTNVTLWLETNVRDAQLAAKSFHCGFNPQNMQTERFSCGKGFDVAAKHLDEAFFVGVSELYPESVCVLASKVDGALPRGCNCEMRERMHLTSYAHDVQKHSLANLTAADLALIDELTREDVQLYDLARQRLLREIAEVEAKHNVTIRCGPDAPRTMKRAYCMR